MKTIEKALNKIYSTRREFYGNFHHTQCGNSVLYGHSGDFCHTWREWISLNSMGKIAKDVNKINFTMLYGNYCYIIIEKFPIKFSPCTVSFNPQGTHYKKVTFRTVMG